MAKTIVAALVATALGACPALASPTAPAQPGTPFAMAQLRAQNTVLRERMGQMQLDLLIADVLAKRDPRGATLGRRDGGPAPQVVAFRK